MTPLLEVSGLTKTFGGLSALSGLDLHVDQGEVVSVIGPNGAGKTTFFNILTGLYRPTVGTIAFDGRDITGMRPDRIVGQGMARTFQNIRLFGTMSALENVLVAEHSRTKA